MQLGILTAPFPETPLGEVAAWAAAEGFTALEIACWPRSGGETRRYAGTSHIDVTDIAAAKDAAAMLAARGVAISALGYYPNPLHPDAAHREAVLGHLRQVITAAAGMGVGLVNTFCGGNRERTLDENWDEARKVWPAIIAHAKDNGVRLAFENCPM